MSEPKSIRVRPWAYKLFLDELEGRRLWADILRKARRQLAEIGA